MRYKPSLFLLLFFITTDIYAQVINAGIGGNNTTQLLQRIDKDVIQQKPDLTIIMVGTNDLLNHNKMISYAQYAENVNELVKKLKNEGIEVLLMSSPPVDSAYLFMRHHRNLYTEAPNEIMNSASDIVEKIALKNKALYLNLNEKFVKLGLPKHNEDLFFRNPINSGAKDGVHPTTLGYHFIAENVFQFLKKKGLLVKYKKIVCFGDSITNGSGSKGKGTVTGENYPSFLARRLAALWQK